MELSEAGAEAEVNRNEIEIEMYRVKQNTIAISRDDEMNLILFDTSFIVNIH